MESFREAVRGPAYNCGLKPRVLYYMVDSSEVAARAEIASIKHDDPKRKFGAVFYSEYGYEAYVYYFDNRTTPRSREKQLRVLKDLLAANGLYKGD